MLLRSDPFRELDRFTEQVLGTRARPAVMPMDAYRKGDEFMVHLDMPGVEPSSIDLTVEKNVLTVSAERRWDADEDVQILASERSQGTFRRQLLLSEGLDVDRVSASYNNGVLNIAIPVAEQAKPRKVEVSASRGGAEPIETTSTP